MGENSIWMPCTKNIAFTTQMELCNYKSFLNTKKAPYYYRLNQQKKSPLYLPFGKEGFNNPKKVTQC